MANRPRLKIDGGIPINWSARPMGYDGGWTPEASYDPSLPLRPR
ncbi:hypothetical protein [Mycobacterium sp. HNNTM2301]